MAARKRCSIWFSAKGERPRMWVLHSSSSASMDASPYVSLMPTRPSEVSSSRIARSAQGSWMPAALSSGPSRKATGVMRTWVMRTSRFIAPISVRAGTGLLDQRGPARDFLLHQRGQFVRAAGDDLHAHLLAQLVLHVGLLQRLLDFQRKALHDGLG